jgi:aminoglycoside 6-adenylyltransferase
VVKGICREELCYAKNFMDKYQMDMLKKMLRWKVGIETGFSVSTGKADKYFKRFLPEIYMQKLSELHANGEFKDMAEKLLLMFDFFHEVADQVSQKLVFSYDKDELKRVKSFAYELLKKHLNSFNPLSGKGPVGAAQ